MDGREEFRTCQVNDADARVGARSKDDCGKVRGVWREGQARRLSWMPGEDGGRPLEDGMHLQQYRISMQAGIGVNSNAEWRPIPVCHELQMKSWLISMCRVARRHDSGAAARSCKACT